MEVLYKCLLFVKENASDFILNGMSYKYDLLVDPLVVTSQAKYQDFLGICN